MRNFLILLFVIAVSSSNIYSQNIVKTNITNNLEELFINTTSDFGSVTQKTLDRYFNSINKAYIFEIEYNGKVIYREGVRKTIPSSRDRATASNMFRFKSGDIYLDAELFSDSEKLSMLESRKITLKEIQGKKFILINDFQPIVQNTETMNFETNKRYGSLKVNIYRLDF